MTDEQSKMVAATWVSVEAMGIPDSIVRRMLSDLAEVIGGQGDHDLALVSAAYRALTNVLHERARDDKKTPLQIQAEAQRAVREIREMGVDVPEVVFTDPDFDLPPGDARRARRSRRLLGRWSRGETHSPLRVP